MNDGSRRECNLYDLWCYKFPATALLSKAFPPKIKNDMAATNPTSPPKPPSNLPQGHYKHSLPCRSMHRALYHSGSTTGRLATYLSLPLHHRHRLRPASSDGRYGNAAAISPSCASPDGQLLPASGSQRPRRHPALQVRCENLVILSCIARIGFKHVCNHQKHTHTIYDMLDQKYPCWLNDHAHSLRICMHVARVIQHANIAPLCLTR